MAKTLEEQIGTMFRENRVAMVKVAYRITARRDYPLEGRKDAEDVVQNVFLHLLEKGTPDEVIRNPKGYLHRCTVNEAISLVRARKREPVDLGKKWAEIPIPAPGMGTDKEMVLQEALAQLDGRQADILRLHDHDGYSSSDIAKMYGMNAPAVRQIVSRGRAEVRRLLSDSSRKTADADLLKVLESVLKGMTNNLAYPNPPVALTDFESAIDSFSVLVIDALDNGKKVSSATRKQREMVVKMVTQLGYYVEAACNGDVATFNSSGYCGLWIAEIRRLVRNWACRSERGKVS